MAYGLLSCLTMRVPNSILAPAVLCVVVTSCGGHGGESRDRDSMIIEPADAATASDAVTAADAGAGATDSAVVNPVPAGSHWFTIVTPDGRTRRYRLYVPPSIDLNRQVPTPIVFNLHGGGGGAEDAESSSRFNDTANENAFAVVYGEGIAGEDASPARPLATWNAGACCGRARDEAVDDVQYIRSVLADVQTRIAVDRQRVYATGFSNGAMLSYRLACEAADIIAAIAPVGAPGREPPNCNPVRPMPILHIHGRQDTCASFTGGLLACGGCFEELLRRLGADVELNKWACQGAEAYTNRWRTRLQCPSEGITSYENGGAQCVTWTSCMDDTEFTRCFVDGLGHTWPGGVVAVCESAPNSRLCREWTDIVGPTSNDIGNDQIWEFLARHQLPSPD